jgi:hypothetical protein
METVVDREVDQKVDLNEKNVVVIPLVDLLVVPVMPIMMLVDLVEVVLVAVVENEVDSMGVV